MKATDKYCSYNEMQKQVLGMLLRVQKIEKEDFLYFVKRLLKQKQRHIHRQKEEHEQVNEKEFVQFLFDDNWCEEENEEIVAGDFQSEKDLLNLIAEDRQIWRNQMVEEVCEYVGFEPDHPILNLLKKIDRADFVREDLVPFADVDSPLPLHNEMTESALHAVLMTIKAVDPQKGDRVLVCGVKGGYLCGLLSSLVGQEGVVCGLDWDADIANHAENALRKYPEIRSNTTVYEQKDVTIGFPQKAPYNIIILNGCVPQVPLILMSQLHESKGRILFYLHKGERSSVCYLVRKNDQILEEQQLSNFLFTPIPGIQGFIGISDLQKQYEEAEKKLIEAKDDLTGIYKKIPYPLAKMVSSAYNARNPDERHKAVLKIAEVLIRFFAFVGINRFDELKIQDENISEILAKILGSPSSPSKPANGHWPQILRMTLKHLKNDDLGSVLHKDYERSLRIPNVLDVCRRIDEMLGRPKRGNDSIKLRDFLDFIIQYRNKAPEGHGGMYSSGFLDQVSDLLLKSFIQILQECALFESYSLVEVYRKEELMNGKKIHVEYCRLTGVQQVRQTIDLNRGEQADQWSRGIGLVAKDKYVLKLSPWMVWTDEGTYKSPDLFIFNGKEGNQYEYITYHNADKYPDQSLEEMLKELCERHPLPEKQKYDINLIKPVIMGFMPIFAADGVISRTEMTSLTSAIHALTPMGIAESENFIKEIISEEYPNVFIE